MSEHDESRRAFLIGTAAGVGAVAGMGLVPAAQAQMHEHKSANGPPHAHAPAMDGSHGAFLNDGTAATIAAFTERLMPGAPGKPGAREAGVLNYIDLALAGAYSDQQDFYRRGLDDWNADNFDHKDLGFIRGAQISVAPADLEAGPIGTAITMNPPEGTPRWGAAYRDFLAQYFARYAAIVAQTENLPSRSLSFIRARYRRMPRSCAGQASRVDSRRDY